MVVSRTEINGSPATADDLAFVAQVNYGHYTTLRVLDRGVRGLDLHLQRLEQSTQALFGSALDGERVRGWIGQIVDDAPASVRVTVFSRRFDRSQPEHRLPVDVLVSAQAAHARVPTPLRVKSVVHARYLPQVKHVGNFSLFHLLRLARQSEWDDVLLTDANGLIAEGSLWNIGFGDGTQVVWPNAPVLAGVTERLLERGLRDRGIACERRPVRLDEIACWRYAFASNAGNPVRLITAIDDIRFVLDDDFSALLKTCYEAQPLQPL